MAGTVGQSLVPTRNRNLTVWVVDLNLVGDSSNGSIPATTLSSDIQKAIGGSYLFAAKSIPGTTNPTASWGFTLVDSDGMDILGGVGAAKSASAVQISIPKQDSAQALYGPVLTLDGALTLNVSGQSVASAQIGIKLYFTSAG